MNSLKALLADRKIRTGLAVLIVLSCAGLLAAWQAGIDARTLKSWWQFTQSYLAAHPGTLFAGLVILPGLPIPTSALLFAAGIAWRDHPLMACGLCLLAMALNLAWTYWLAASPARNAIRHVLGRAGFDIPELLPQNQLKLVLLLKLTPGIPFFVQNYLCGILRVSFVLYMSVSMLCNGLIGTGIVLSGVGLGDGKLTPLLTGLSLVSAGVVLTHWVRSWLEKRKVGLERSLDDGSGASKDSI